jgi:hypothetical protein
MADSIILAKYIVLQDTVQGNVNPNLPQPTGGFIGSDHHNVATAVYDVGTKIQVYDETAKGYATFVYLKNGTASATALVAGTVMVPAGATANSTYLTYIYTNNKTDSILGASCVVALSAMTDDYYGWFWCGGVAPIGITNSGIVAATTLITSNSVTVGAISTITTAGNNAGLGLATTLKLTCGFSMKADD